SFGGGLWRSAAGGDVARGDGRYCGRIGGAFLQSSGNFAGAVRGGAALRVGERPQIEGFEPGGRRGYFGFAGGGAGKGVLLPGNDGVVWCKCGLSIGFVNSAGNRRERKERTGKYEWHECIAKRS